MQIGGLGHLVVSEATGMDEMVLEGRERREPRRVLRQLLGESDQIGARQCGGKWP